MTFIISAATRNAAFQVADTRVTTTTGTLVDDATIKTTLVNCKDAKLILSFTGLARIKGKPTDKWLVEKLNAFEAWRKVFQEIANHLRDELTRALESDENLEKWGLEVPIIGLGVSPDGVRQPAIAVITNTSEPVPERNSFKYIDRKGRTFQRYILTGVKPGDLTDFIGIYGAIPEGHLDITGVLKHVRKGLKTLPENADPRAILDKMVAALRLHRKDAKLQKVIGEHCVGAAINSDYNTISVSYGFKGKGLLIPNIVRVPVS